MRRPCEGGKYWRPMGECPNLSVCWVQDNPGQWGIPGVDGKTYLCADCTDEQMRQWAADGRSLGGRSKSLCK